MRQGRCHNFIIGEVMTVHKMKKRNAGGQKFFRRFLGVLLAVAVITIMPFCAIRAADTGQEAGGSGNQADGEWYRNPDTGYHVELHDDASLLTDGEKQSLAEAMKPITDYGSVGFFTSNTGGYSTEALARGLYSKYLRKPGSNGGSGTLFLIDMADRNIYIYSEGSIYRTITKGYANTITDNIYRYASDGKYFQCAYEAFGQEQTLLEGRRISQPMKYISNIFLALVLAFFINYMLVRAFSQARKPSESALLEGIFAKQTLQGVHARFINETRKYSPQSSSSGSGGHRGGGGGHRGGGGGHHF